MNSDDLKRLLHYAPESGEWTWLVRRGGIANAGSRAGWIDSHTGYLRIEVGGKREHAHRLAFLYMEGSLPPNDVDHIDGNPSNCRWANLRHATTSQNLARAAKPVGKSGARGVRLRHGKWEVRVNVNGAQIHRSIHQTKEEAIAARNAAALRHHGQFARTQ